MKTEIIVDAVEDGYSIGRNFRQSANIDTVIYVNEELTVGEFYNIKITNKLDYDLEGEKL